MNHARIYVACFLVMVFYSSVAAFDIQQGIHGLKSKESPMEYKLAMYYLPLAAKLNQDLLESAAPDAGDMPPSTNDQSLKSTPLIEY